MQKKKVLVFLAKAFETMEFSVFIDVLGWARNDYGHNISVDTCGFTEKVISTFNVPVIVGGAVITKDFADSIGAAYYAKDAMHAVEILNSSYGLKKDKKIKQTEASE